MHRAAVGSFPYCFKHGLPCCSTHSSCLYIVHQALLPFAAPIAWPFPELECALCRSPAHSAACVHLLQLVAATLSNSHVSETTSYRLCSPVWWHWLTGTYAALSRQALVQACDLYMVTREPDSNWLAY